MFLCDVKSWGPRIWNFKISHSEPHLWVSPLQGQSVLELGLAAASFLKGGLPSSHTPVSWSLDTPPPPRRTCVGESSAWGASPRRAHSLGLSAASRPTPPQALTLAL